MISTNVNLAIQVVPNASVQVRMNATDVMMRIIKFSTISSMITMSMTTMVHVEYVPNKLDIIMRRSIRISHINAPSVTIVALDVMDPGN